MRIGLSSDESSTSVAVVFAMSHSTAAMTVHAEAAVGETEGQIYLTSWYSTTLIKIVPTRCLMVLSSFRGASSTTPSAPIIPQHHFQGPMTKHVTLFYILINMLMIIIQVYLDV